VRLARPERIVCATCAAWPKLSASKERLAEGLQTRGRPVDVAPWNGPFDPFSLGRRWLARLDRFLEHARIYHFENGVAEYYLASADWMPRNLDHRVETAFPILDPRLQAEIREVPEVQLQYTAMARILEPDGTSIRAHAVGVHPYPRRSASTS
jgi:Polyphosphate kinase C-terminal domain 2